MERSNPSKQEIVGDRLLEEISQFEQISLGEGAAKCQMCGSPLYEGDAVVVYVFRPAGEVMFQVGRVVCGGQEHRFPEEYTLGVRELLVEGRVGWCSDGARQSSWQVLLDPEVLAVSAAATKSVRLIPDGGSMDADVESSVEDCGLRAGPLVDVSNGEARRRMESANGGEVRGLFWGEVQR